EHAGHLDYDRWPNARGLARQGAAPPVHQNDVAGRRAAHSTLRKKDEMSPHPPSASSSAAHVSSPMSDHSSSSCRAAAFVLRYSTTRLLSALMRSFRSLLASSSASCRTKALSPVPRSR